MNNSRVRAIDNLRVIAILGVILIHTTTRVLERTYYNLELYWSTLFLNQIVRFAVPLFLLISGFVLELRYWERLDFLTYVKRRFSRIFIPYIFWSLFYYYFFYTTNKDNIFYTILTGNASYQLYFIPTLCIFYLVFPFLHKIYKYIMSPIFLILLGILQLYILRDDYFIKNISVSDPVRISVLGFSFFIIGMITAHNYEKILEFSKKWKLALATLFVTLGYYIFSEGYSLYFKTYNINSFYSSWRPSTFFFTIVSALFFYTILEKINLYKISKLSFLVFFIHVIILEIVWKYLVNFVAPNLYFDLIFFALVSVISFLSAHIIHKIPYISKIVG